MKYLIFPVIALLVVLPWLFQPGYLFLLDWQGTPTLPVPHLDQTGGISGMPIQLFLHIVALMTGSAPAQTIVIFLMLATSGYATMLLVKNILPKQTHALIPYTAGIFAMLNPFVYNRIHMGHIYLLFGYALTPLAILLVLRFLKKPSIRTGLIASFFSGLIIAISIHHIILLPLIIALFVWHERNTKKITLSQYSSLTIPFMCIAAVIIIVAVFNTDSPLQKINSDDMLVFRPVTQCSRDVQLDVLLLAAQWRNRTATQAPCTVPTVFTAGIVLLCIIVIGALKNKRLLIGTILFTLLACIPMIPAMRDSAKFLSGLALIESVLLAYGVAHISQTKKSISIATFIIVCIMGFPFAWGLHETVSAKEYPASWYGFENQLATMHEKPTVLFLPWHLYMPFDFTNKATISNPARNFFSHASIIQGDNLEIHQGSHSIPTQSSRSISNEVELTLKTLHTPAFPDALRQLIQNNHIQYIALAHGSPEETMYKAVLYPLPYLHIVSDTPGLTVWQFQE